MSYARFGWGDSDVYVYGTRMGNKDVFECCACWLNPSPPVENEGIEPPEDLSPLEKLNWNGPLFSESTYVDTEQQMIDHLLAHRAAGHTVPQKAIDRLTAERDGMPYQTDVQRELSELTEMIERSKRLPRALRQQRPPSQPPEGDQ